MPTFQTRLKSLRYEMGMSQKKLAEEIGMSQQTIAKWETGDSTPDPSTLLKLADIFDISVDFLLGRNDIDIKVDEENKKQKFLFASKPAKRPELTNNAENEIIFFLGNSIQKLNAIKENFDSLTQEEKEAKIFILTQASMATRKIFQEIEKTKFELTERKKMDKNREYLLTLSNLLEENKFDGIYHRLQNLSNSNVSKLREKILQDFTDIEESIYPEGYKYPIGFTDPTAARQYYEANASFAPSSSGEEPTDEEIIQLANELYEEQKANKKQ